MPALLCTCLVGPTPEYALLAAQTNLQFSDIFELRLDRILVRDGSILDDSLSVGSPQASPTNSLTATSRTLADAVLSLGLPIILTVRHQADGGAWPRHREADRFALIEDLIDFYGADPRVVFDIDIEASTVRLADRGIDYAAADRAATRLALARQGGAGANREKSSTRKVPTLIRSVHIFEPGIGVAEAADELAAITRRLPVGGLAKLAVTPAGLGDIVRLFEVGGSIARLAAGRAGEDGSAPAFVLIGMGEFGVATRILAARMGSAWTYATPPGAGQPAAAGQLTPEDLCKMYRFRSLSPQTTIFGIIGNPVAHSRSPQWHNAVFAERSLDAVYIPVLAESADKALALANLLDIRGFSVTVPHKEAVRDWLAAEDEGTRIAGACNTVFRTERGWQGVNTDIPGLLDPLPADIRGTVLVLGAGGAARAALAGLAPKGLQIILANRTLERAQQLAAEFADRLDSTARIRPIRLEPEELAQLGDNERIELIIQTTSLGMKDELDPSEGYRFRGFETAYDIVYNRGLTPFLKRAQAAGCRILEGGGMFEAQARLQSEIFVRVAARREQEST